MLKEIARAAGMSPSRIHSYLVSLVRAGLAGQDPLTARYDIGPAVLRLGVKALYRLDYVKTSSHAVQRLRELTDFNVLLAIWGERGPVIIEFQRSLFRPLPMNVQVGSSLSLLSTAAGQLFLAHLPRKMTAAHVAHELKLLAAQNSPTQFKTQADIEELISRVRTTGLGRAERVLLPGQLAVSSPVLDQRGQIVSAVSMTAVASRDEFRGESVAVQHLKAVTADASYRLGFSPDERAAAAKKA